MKFKYYGKTFTGSRQEIIESLTQFLRGKSLEYCNVGDFSLCEEWVHLHGMRYILDNVKNTLIRQAVAKIPQGPLEIAIHSHTLLHYLLIDGIEVASQSKRFTVNQILKYGGGSNIVSNFDIKVEIRKLITDHYVLYLNDSLVATEDRPFTMFDLMYACYVL